MENYGQYVGAVYCGGSSSPTFSDCTFSRNWIEYGGGAIRSEYGPYLTLINCTFSENGAVSGGALFCLDCSAIVSNCTFAGNWVRMGYPGMGNMGGGMYCQGSTVTVSSCTFFGNSAEYYEYFGGTGGGMYCLSSTVAVSSCTFFGNSAVNCGGVSGATTLENTIVAFSAEGQGVCGGTLVCCDIFGNEGGDWVGDIADQLGINGNFSACPTFCNAVGDDFTLCDESPCLPGNHPDGYDCGLIGSWGQGCVCGPSVTEPTTWGGIKAIYR
jgi:hypothetical protein